MNSNRIVYTSDTATVARSRATVSAMGKVWRAPMVHVTHMITTLDSLNFPVEHLVCVPDCSGCVSMRALEVATP